MERISSVSKVKSRIILQAKRRLINNSSNRLLKRDFLNLFQIFPIETWDSIINKLSKCPDDLENISNSSTVFRILVTSQTTYLLFEKVLPVVAHTVWKNEGLQGLPVHDILNCRQVCSKWNHSVHKLVPKNFQHFGEGTEDTQSKTIGNAFKSVLRNEFKNLDEKLDEESVHNFFKHFEPTHPAYHLNGRNPFIWGTFSVEINSAVDQDTYEEDYEHYLDGITSMLCKYGSYLHDFSICVNSCQLFEDTQRLHEWFVHTPNLKKLNFGIDIDWRYDKVYLDEYENEIPIPKLKFLETLHANDLPVSVFNQLIQQNDHITTLNIPIWLDGYNILTFSLPNLQSLQIGCCSIELVKKLDSPHVKWSLKSLNIEFENDPNNELGHISLFQMIQDKFSDTLVVLDVKLHCYEHDAEDAFAEQCKSFKLDLPKLKKFKMTMCDFEIVCLDFLLPMRSNLEEISLGVKLNSYDAIDFHYKQEVAVTSGHVVQFLGYEAKMLDSNIWAIFKKMKKLEVELWTPWQNNRREFRSYSREEWGLNNWYT